MSYKMFAPTMSSIFRPRIFILEFLQFFLIKLISFKNRMCLYCFVLYVREIWAHIDIFQCQNVSFNIVAAAVSSILRAGILTLDFIQFCFYFPLYVHEIWAHMDIFYCPNVIFNISPIVAALVPKHTLKWPKLIFFKYLNAC